MPVNISQVRESDAVSFDGIPPSYYLLGLLSAFDNRFQAMADRVMKVITWKQFFAVICISLCKEPPGIGELAEIMGSSHQNVKQLLMKLQRKDFVRLEADPSDARRQRVVLTQACLDFCRRNDDASAALMERLFEGVTPEQLAATISTVTRIEDNMKNVGEVAE